MPANLLTGRPVADALWQKIRDEVAHFTTPPTLALVNGSDAAADAYGRSIERSFIRNGLAIRHHSAQPTTAAYQGLLQRLSDDRTIDGVLVLTPLGDSVDLQDVISALDPGKDVDGQHPSNLGNLVQRRHSFVPSTALGGLRLLQYYGIPLRGQKVVIVGRSPVVGMPLALLLSDQDATVTICHSRTRDLAASTRSADVLCVATGRAGLIGPEHILPGATVLDFGTNPIEGGGLVGDVQTKAVSEIAGALTPVPGGPGPVTVAVLAEQTVRAARSRR